MQICKIKSQFAGFVGVYAVLNFTVIGSIFAIARNNRL